eukprot:15366047-Ditylum_brightwellii.AAC.1
MKLIQRKNGYAVSHSSSYGPSFGGGYDICVCNNANSNSNSYTKVGHTYECPAGQSIQRIADLGILMDKIRTS